jgi:hypothetical protein
MQVTWAVIRHQQGSLAVQQLGHLQARDRREALDLARRQYGPAVSVASALSLAVSSAPTVPASMRTRLVVPGERATGRTVRLAEPKPRSGRQKVRVIFEREPGKEWTQARLQMAARVKPAVVRQALVDLERLGVIEKVFGDRTPAGELRDARWRLASSQAR